MGTTLSAAPEKDMKWKKYQRTKRENGWGRLAKYYNFIFENLHVKRI